MCECGQSVTYNLMRHTHKSTHTTTNTNQATQYRYKLSTRCSAGVPLRERDIPSSNNLFNSVTSCCCRCWLSFHPKLVVKAKVLNDSVSANCSCANRRCNSVGILRCRGTVPEGGGDGGAVSLPCNTQRETRIIRENISKRVQNRTQTKCCQRFDIASKPAEPHAPRQRQRQR